MWNKLEARFQWLSKKLELLIKEDNVKDYLKWQQEINLLKGEINGILIAKMEYIKNEING